MSDDLYQCVDVAIDSGSPYNTGTRDQPLFDIVPSIPNVEAMSVISANIPFTYLVIDATNNTLKFTTPDTLGTTYTIYLAPGTYTATNFVTMFNNIVQIQYDTSSPQNGGVSASGGSGTWEDVYNAYRLTAFIYESSSTLTLYTDTTGTAGTKDFQIDFSDSTSAFQSMGFDQQAGYDATLATIFIDATTNTTKTVYYVEAPYTVNMSGPGFIYLISDLAQQIKDGAVRTERNTDSILQIVPVNNNFKGTISFTNPKPEKIWFSKTQINRIQCSLILGHRTTFCPGNDYTYYNANGAPKIVDHLSLMGQPYQVVIRFYSRKETTQDYKQENGDKFIHTESQQTGSFNPSLQKYNAADIKPRKRDRQGIRLPQPNPDRVSSYPQPPPGSRVPPPSYRRIFPAQTVVRR